jgi:hypothetical protein
MASVNVRPCSPIHDVVYRVAGNSVLGSDLVAAAFSGVFGAYGSHIGFCQLRARMCLADTIASFPEPVLVVVSDGSKPQMGRVTARRVVAFVQNVSLWWNGAVDAFIGKAMCSQLFALFVTNDAVALPVFGSGPGPAGVRLAWMVVEQEPISQRHKARAVTTCLRAIRASWTTRRTQTTVFTEFHRMSLSPMMCVN